MMVSFSGKDAAVAPAAAGAVGIPEAGEPTTPDGDAPGSAAGREPAADEGAEEEEDEGVGAGGTAGPGAGAGGNSFAHANRMPTQRAMAKITRFSIIGRPRRGPVRRKVQGSLPNRRNPDDRNGIKPRARKRMTATDAPEREGAATPKTTGLDRLLRIARTGRLEATAGTEEGDQRRPIARDDPQRQGLHRTLQALARRASSSNSAATCPVRAVAAS